MRSWHLKHARSIIYVGGAIAAVAISVVAWTDGTTIDSHLVTARQLLGLWAMGLLITSMLLGPVTAVLPWIPGRASLMYGRRALGILCFAFALLHVVCYLISVFRRDWHELYSPGVIWVSGLGLGLIALAGMSALALTSRDASVKRLGGRRWKALHRVVYAVYALAFIHALFLGADFGLNRAPDVRAEADMGAMLGFIALTGLWVASFLLRRRHWKWTPRWAASTRGDV